MILNSATYKITCCKDCPDRFPGCHSSCEKYIAEKAAYDAKRAEFRKKYDTSCKLNEQKYDSIHKATKRNHYRNKYK